MALFQNYCSGCGKSIPTFAIDRSGNVPLVFCSSVCRTDYDREAKMETFKVIVPFRKAISTEQLTNKLSKESWRGNNGGQFIGKNQIVREEIPV